MPVLTMRDALNQALREEMKRDESVFLLGEDIGLYDGSFKVTRGLWKEFGEKRVLDTPIAEEIIVGTAIGAAMAGLRPVAEMMTVNFIMVAMDQVVNAAAHIRYMFGGGTNVPLVIRTPGGGGHQLGAQHSHSHENWFAHVPGLKVVAPGTPADAKGMLKSAIRDNNPVMFIENEGTYAVKGEVRRASISYRWIRTKSSALAMTSPSALIRACWSSPRRPPPSWRKRASAPKSSTCGRCARSTWPRSSSRSRRRAG